MKQLQHLLTQCKELVTCSFGMLLLVAFSANITLTSCSNDDETVCESSSKQTLTLNITPDGWNDELSFKATTRASYSALAEGSSGNKTFNMSFTSGDAIGLFACDKTGKVVTANLKVTYNGSAWNAEDPIEYVTGLGSYTFFAYYPWVSSLTGAPAVNSTPDLTSADTFFSSAISSWTPAADQSDVTKFTSQDLMVAKGTNSTPYFHEVQVSFTMTHQMGLLVTKPTLTYYDIDNPGDTHDVVQSFTTNIPYTNGSYCYFFCKPGVATTLGDKTATVAKGQVWQLYFSNGEPITKFW